MVTSRYRRNLIKSAIFKGQVESTLALEFTFSSQLLSGILPHDIRPGWAGNHTDGSAAARHFQLSIPDSFTPSFRGMETDVPICKKP